MLEQILFLLFWVAVLCVRGCLAASPGGTPPIAHLPHCDMHKSKLSPDENHCITCQSVVPSVYSRVEKRPQWEGGNLEEMKEAHGSGN